MAIEEIRAAHPDPEAFDAWLADYEASLRQAIARRVNSMNYTPTLVASDIWGTARQTRRAAVRVILGR